MGGEGNRGYSKRKTMSFLLPIAKWHAKPPKKTQLIVILELVGNHGGKERVEKESNGKRFKCENVCFTSPANEKSERFDVESVVQTLFGVFWKLDI